MIDHTCIKCGKPLNSVNWWIARIGDRYEERAYKLCNECAALADSTLWALIGGDDKSRWAELFGTPERAARTLTHNAPSTCDECVLIDICEIGMPVACIVNDCDALLEWLRGEGE